MKESTIQKLSAWFAGAEEKLTKRITPATLAVILTMVYLLSLVPLLWIGWYNYPSADDYSIGSNCRQIPGWDIIHPIF